MFSRKSLNIPYNESRCESFWGCTVSTGRFFDAFLVPFFLSLLSIFAGLSSLKEALSLALFCDLLLMLFERLLLSNSCLLSALFSRCLSYSLNSLISVSRLSFLPFSFWYFSVTSSFSFFISRFIRSTSLRRMFWALYFSLRSSSFKINWCSNWDLCSSYSSKSLTFKSCTP